MDGGEAMGNSLGRAQWGRSEMEATTGGTEGKPWEIARGELPLRPPSRRFHPFPPHGPLPKLFPTVSPLSTLSSLPYRSLAASATKREPKH